MNKFFYIFSLCLLCFFSQSCKSEAEKQGGPVTVTVQRISFSDESHSQMYVGRVETSRTSLISPSYPGRLSKISVHKGQRVKAGEILATINSPSVKSMYDAAKASFDQAKDALDRVNKVYSSGSISELKYVEVKTSYAKAEAAYNAASETLEDCKIKAPYYGVVGDVFFEEGEELSVVEPLFKLMDLRSLEVHASVPESEYSVYYIGQGVEVAVDAVGKKLNAVLESKGFEASPLSHTYDFTFRIEGNTGNIMPGMVCKVYMTVFAGQSVIIPSSAVRIDSEGRYVWCIAEDGSVVKKHVTIGGFENDGVVVEEGLSSGDLLVTEGGRKISTGMRNIRIGEYR